MTKYASIFDIQRFSLHDGPGLRTTVFFKGCNLKCLWCQNPESIAMKPEIAFFSEQCIECYKCSAVCSAGAISGLSSGKINRELCSLCGKCADICPAGAIRIVGRKWSVDELTLELLRDRDFFEESGGGVTLSGGEPMMQADFVLDLCRELKNKKIHIVLETAGHIVYTLFDNLSGLVDIIYLDIKHCDSHEHYRLTGSGNENIIRNMAYLAEKGFCVQPRMPVIPGNNDDESNIRNTSDIIKNAGLTSIHLLPYHKLGNSKLQRFGSNRKMFDAVLPDKGKMEDVGKVFEKEGIHAVIYE